MLKNIRLHVEKDEVKQASLETKLAEHISKTQKENINAFQRFIPTMLPFVKAAKSQNISIFCNKFGNYNIVDYGLGRVFYGFDPVAEIDKQVDQFKQHSLYTDFNSQLKVSQKNGKDSANLITLPAFQSFMNSDGFPEKCELLVVLGLGLGHHLLRLVREHDIDHLIVYEPELQYFSCSVLVMAWRELLDVAKKKGTSIYFQLEKDGRDILSDIGELRSQIPVTKGYIYQHYHHPVFNSIFKEFSNKGWSELCENGISFKMSENNNEFCPSWSPLVELDQYHLSDPDSTRFQQNLLAFKKFFPQIYREFKNYKPSNWLPISNANGQINIINKDNLTVWYGEEPNQDCILNFENYSEQPNKDGLVLGYSGEKLKHYIHYKFVKETEDLLKNIEEQEGVLPTTIKSIIMFGLGVGYQLEHLMDKHKVEKLFICEPNRDFFYASLLSLDWASILKKIDDQEGRLYINIGDDGTNLFRDLLNQFYSVGPYVLSHTYFYQSYYNAALTRSINQLREQLQVVISMGEYFDHARYGIAHTREGLKRGYSHMLKNPSTLLSFSDKEVPVFLVGNGPSIDGAINAIKSWQDKAIVVSCGTALQVLHKNGITPDFHAEIEQNRSTFDWAARIEDFDYLANINLISCNGIHPDTCDLYKDVFIGFKEGESSTVSALAVLGDSNYESLKFAFPTVTNFALNFFIKLGFKQLYFIGVDLGFADNANHHSKQSGYYDKQGEELYDYGATNNVSIVVPGNFRKTIFTKQEFKIARMVMEQSLAATKVECYNTSDGAKIIGSMPLRMDDILLVSDTSNKEYCLRILKANCFGKKSKSEFIEAFENKYSKDTLHKEMEMFKRRLAQPVETLEEAELLIESQKRMLFASYQQGQSILFYLTYGTVNYANVVLNKIAYSSVEFNVQEFDKARLLWLRYFSLIVEEAIHHLDKFDTSNSFLARRVFSFLNHSLAPKKILIVTDSFALSYADKGLVHDFGLSMKTTYCTVDDFLTGNAGTNNDCDYLIFYKKTFEHGIYEKFQSKRRDLDFHNKPTLVLLDSIGETKCIKDADENICFYICPGNFLETEVPYQCNDYNRLMISYFMLMDMHHFRFFYGKYRVSKDDEYLQSFSVGAFTNYHYYDMGFAIAARDFAEVLPDQVFNNGCRAVNLSSEITVHDLVSEYIDEDKCLQMKQQILDRRPYLKEKF